MLHQFSMIFKRFKVQSRLDFGMLQQRLGSTAAKQQLAVIELQNKLHSAAAALKEHQSAQ